MTQNRCGKFLHATMEADRRFRGNSLDVAHIGLEIAQIALKVFDALEIARMVLEIARALYRPRGREPTIQNPQQLFCVCARRSKTGTMCARTYQKKSWARLKMSYGSVRTLSGAILGTRYPHIAP